MNISQKYHDPVMLKSFLNSYNIKYPRRRFINPAGFHKINKISDKKFAIFCWIYKILKGIFIII